MEKQINYVGAAIFWLYIVAALFFSILVIHTIVSLPETSNANQRYHSRDIKIFSSLACISFVTLSYNMLNVLIESFLAWHGKPFVFENFKTRDIWRWSIESTLFQNFGEAITPPTLASIWTTTALLATMSVCLFMGSEGKRRHVPHLWAFFCLSQILPVSFVQNLFYLALLRLPQTGHRAGAPSLLTFVMDLVYLTSIYVAHHGGIWLLMGIIVARLVLFSPLFLCRLVSDRVLLRDKTRRMGIIEGRVMQREFIAASLHIFGTAVMHILWNNSEATLHAVLSALFEHPAVSSLGCDLILCVFSFSAWILTSGNRDTAYAKMDEKVEQNG